MYQLRTRTPILVIALVLAFTVTSYAAPSDWADVVEAPSPKATSTSKRTTTTKAPTKQRNTKKIRAAKRSAVKHKAKSRAKSKRGR